jgi:hypothetical protein
MDGHSSHSRHGLIADDIATALTCFETGFSRARIVEYFLEAFPGQIDAEDIQTLVEEALDRQLIVQVGNLFYERDFMGIDKRGQSVSLLPAILPEKPWTN